MITLPQGDPDPLLHGKLLIVDDELASRDALRRVVQRNFPAVQVMEAADGQEAIERIGQETPDLIISDYRMPGVNGLTFLEMAAKRLPDVPRIMVTAYPDVQVATDAINRGEVERFIAKPLRASEILALVARFLDERRQRVQRDQAFARSLDLARRKIQE